MTGNSRIKGLLLIVSVAVLLVACEVETTGPDRAGSQPSSRLMRTGPDESLLTDSWVAGVSGCRSLRWDCGRFDMRKDAIGFSLTPHDHTTIMEAVLHNIPEIVARLPQNQVSSGTEVLEAALTVPAIDAHTKTRISLVLQVLARLEQDRERIPMETQQAMSEARNGLEACHTIDDKIDVMQSMIDSGEYHEHPGFQQALGVCIEILHEGAKTVYVPRFLFCLKRLAVQDLIGAIAGGVTGAIAGGVGVVPGAIAGAVGSSAADAIGQATGWW